MATRRRMAAPLAAAAIVAGLSSLAAQPPQAQDAPSTKGVVRKHHVPISSDLVKISLPRPAEADLSNGLHLIVLEDRRLPQISFQLFIPGAGGYYDPDDKPGLAGITAALIREGTASRTSSEISQQLEVMAASLAIGAGAASTEAAITGSCLTDQATKLIDLAADVLLHPAFPDAELARYTQRTRATVAQQRTNPSFLAAEMFSRAVYGRHPAAHVGPTVDALDRVTRDDLVAFHRAHYLPDHAVLAIAGDVSMAQARFVVEQKLSPWKKQGAAPGAVSDPAPIAGAKILFVARPGSVQTNLIVGTQAIAHDSPDYDVLQVMNKIIGGGPTGRLFIHLREEKGYTYGASSALNAPLYRGEWQAATSVRTDVTEPALRDLLGEIATLRDEPVSDEDLADAKRSMTA
ncbi:MAG TPA: pitrilysin family protein, partial [Vicinamibacterales bacterium]|nr:pitrilysin family protein [Vicinamibacterales bacterium]